MKSFAKTAGAGMLVLALMGSQANGQALRGHNTNAPVDVAADRIEVQDRSDRAIFSGDVIARQGDMTLSAARLTVAYSDAGRSEEHTSELQSLMRISSAVFCLKKKKSQNAI